MLPTRPVVEPVSTVDLAQWLQSEWSMDVLVLDCRPFMVYNSSHVRSAHNVHCPPILKRRTGGSLPLEHIVRCQQTRVKLITGVIRSVVVYDDNSHCLSDIQADSNITIVLRSIREGAGMQSVYFLKDGFSRFKSHFPHLCQTQPSSLPCDLMEYSSSPLPYTSCRKPRLRDTVKYQPSTDQGDPVEVLPWLYLGNAFHAGQEYRLQTLRISAILNVCSAHDAPPTISAGFAHKKIPIDDTCTTDVLQCFPDAIHFIDSVRQKQGRVLVHCQAGISRSATICIAYLIHYKHMSLEDAYDHVKCRRNLIAPNLNFMRQLVEFERHVLSGKETNAILVDSSDKATNVGPGVRQTGVPGSVPLFTLPLTPCTQQATTASVFHFDMSPSSTVATTPNFASNPLLSPG